MSFELPGVKANSDIEKLFKIIGFIVVQWGHNEQCLDLIVEMIFRHFDGHPLLTERPVFLKPKIKFLNKCFVQIPELNQFRSESDKLLPRFSEAGEKRNNFVHAAISETFLENGSFSFVKIAVKPNDSHSVYQFTFDHSDWPAFRNELLSLGA
ncbi:hypothetical protein A1507_08495 [Methylomonas koyamae]|uniref:Uncharacterized protein n=1 Tax=Methylomonas koyamae TaxID=702114 RepID=A0A177NM72_9GAMM|nr:hypothetical protein [Methylomonas koyamae]OAI18932.1 hypothetical protein A1507_08495 [Methylomonas koyamae]